MRRLIAETEAACDELLVEAATLGQPAAMPPTAVKRLKELRRRALPAGRSGRPTRRWP